MRLQTSFIAFLAFMVPASGEVKLGADNVRLILPDTVYATVGVEANIYFDNIVLCVNRANYIFDADCKKGQQQAERWTFTPKAKDVGTYELLVKVFNADNKLVASGKTKVRVTPADADKGKAVNMLCIGDSLTQHSWYVQNLLELSAKSKAPKLTMIGTNRWPSKQFWPANRHEGYGGWTARRFATDAKKSPFIFNGKLDLKAYCRKNNAGKLPDVVTIFLGCNDIFYANDANVDKMAADMFKYYDQLIDMVSKADSNIKIGLILPVPPAGTQDAFGANYTCGQTRWQYKRNQHRLVERMLKKYSGREKDNIYLVPAYLNLDSINGFPSRVSPVNSRTATANRRLCNGVHPAKPGYYQLGDSIYAWLKAVLAESK